MLHTTELIHVEEKLSKLVSIFKAELESLSGHLHLVSTNKAGELIARIAKEKGVKLAVKCMVPFEDEINIAEAFGKTGISLVEIGTRDIGNVKDTITAADMGLSGADLAIAEIGAIAIASRKDEDKLVTCLPRVHVAIIPSSLLVHHPDDALPFLQSTLRDSQPCVVSFISGPSRTGDIEMKLVLGVHGPHEVHVVMLEDR
ncbi:MAG TPA: LUD domain-containing protein [Candidatus Bathyarchaeia archaeon]|nr:LUD domain-containing protein [Candidatus Bathyarchaeia archaeon]